MSGRKKKINRELVYICPRRIRDQGSWSCFSGGKLVVAGDEDDDGVSRKLGGFRAY